MNKIIKYILKIRNYNKYNIFSNLLEKKIENIIVYKYKSKQVCQSNSN